MKILAWVCGLIVAVVGLSAAAVMSITPVAPPHLPPPNSIVDMHAHVAGLGRGCDECFVAPVLTDSYKFDWYLRAFGTTHDEMHRIGDAIVADRLEHHIQGSLWVKQAVILAMDGVIGDDGTLDRAATQIYIPNAYVAELSAREPAFLFGASINPNRPDAIERLEQVARTGAVLIKWIPAIMNIDPAAPQFDDFYRRMAALKLPLLVHVGDENAFHHANNALGDPLKLRRPLELGVTVIAAHMATTGEIGEVENFDRLLPLFAEYENLYTEISSLTQVNKLGYLVRALERPALHSRMMHGSDWPLQFFPLVWAGWHLGRAPIAQLRYAASLNNPLDRDIALKAALGVPTTVFERSALMLAR